MPYIAVIARQDERIARRLTPTLRRHPSSLLFHAEQVGSREHAIVSNIEETRAVEIELTSNTGVLYASAFFLRTLPSFVLKVRTEVQHLSTLHLDFNIS